MVYSLYIMILELMYNIYMVGLLWFMSKHSNNNFWLRSRAPSAANPATLQAVPYFHLHEVHDIVHDMDVNMVSLSYIKFIFKKTCLTTLPLMFLNAKMHSVWMPPLLVVWCASRDLDSDSWFAKLIIQNSLRSGLADSKEPQNKKILTKIKINCNYIMNRNCVWNPSQKKEPN